MKQFLSLLTAAALTVSLAGCRTSAPAPTEPAAEVPETTAAASAPTEITVTVPAATEPVLDAAQRARLEIYQNVLRQFLHERTTPDGTAVQVDTFFGDITSNQFAIFDADSDGEDELVIWFTTAPTAGCVCWVYGCDVETNTVYEELSAYPYLEFYTGGLVKCLYSHNHGLAPDVEGFWPYGLMGYNPAAREFETLAQVDGWSKAAYPKDSEGNPFPDDIDVENRGVVYFVTQGIDREPFTDTLSQEAYNAWAAALFGSATQIEPNPMSITDENIDAIV